MNVIQTPWKEETYLSCGSARWNWRFRAVCYEDIKHQVCIRLNSIEFILFYFTCSLIRMGPRYICLCYYLLLRLKKIFFVSKVIHPRSLIPSILPLNLLRKSQFTRNYLNSWSSEKRKHVFSSQILFVIYHQSCLNITHNYLSVCHFLPAYGQCLQWELTPDRSVNNYNELCWHNRNASSTVRRTGKRNLISYTHVIKSLIYTYECASIAN